MQRRVRVRVRVLFRVGDKGGSSIQGRRQGLGQRQGESWEPTCRSTETGGRTVTRSTRASTASGRARQPTSGAADSTAPPEVAQCDESVKLTDRLLLVLTPSEPA